MPSAAEPELSELVRAVGAGGSFPSFTAPEEEQEDAAAAAEVELELARCDEALVVPGCGHVFHRECIDEWLLHSSTCCPIDKTDLRQQ